MQKKNLLRSQVTDANRDAKQQEIDEVEQEIQDNLRTMKENRKASDELRNYGYSDARIK